MDRCSRRADSKTLNLANHGVNIAVAIKTNGLLKVGSDAALTRCVRRHAWDTSQSIGKDLICDAYTSILGLSYFESQPDVVTCCTDHHLLRGFRRKCPDALCYTQARGQLR